MIEIIENPEKEVRLEKCAEAWNAVPSIGEAWKDESVEFRKPCAQLLANQAAYFSNLDSEQLEKVLKAYNFKNPEDCLLGIIPFYKKYSKKDNIKFVVLETSRDVINYKSHGDDCQYLARCTKQPVSKIDEIYESLDNGFLAVLIPFIVSKDGEPCIFTEWVGQFKEDVMPRGISKYINDIPPECLYENSD